MIELDSYGKHLSKGEISLVVSSSEKTSSTIKDILSYLENQEEFYTIYVTISKPYSTVDSFLKKEGFDTDRFFYIDGASKLTGSATLKKADNVVYFHPQDLTSMSIALTETVDSLSERSKTVLIFDALSSLTMYNEEKLVDRFTQSLVNRMRKKDVITVLFTVDEETDEDTKSRIGRVVDQTINSE